MAIDAMKPLSRRALITGAIGAVGATAASAIGTPMRVSAAADRVRYLNDEDNDHVLVAESALAGHGVRGISFDSVGVMGLSEHDTGVVGSAQTGVHGLGVQAGVRGESNDGRGGVFLGGKAQVRLAPGGRDNHPSTGSAGDLYVDKRKRLWFCRGGSSWVRLA